MFQGKEIDITIPLRVNDTSYLKAPKRLPLLQKHQGFGGLRDSLKR